VLRSDDSLCVIAAILLISWPTSRTRKTTGRI